MLYIVGYMSESYRYMDWVTLRKLVSKAKRLKLNRGTNVNVWLLDALKVFPVTMALSLDDGAIFRCQIVGNDDGKNFWLDILPKDFNRLKSVALPS